MDGVLKNRHLLNIAPKTKRNKKLTGFANRNYKNKNSGAK